MRRFTALALLALLLTMVGALIAVAVGTRSTDNGDAPLLTIRNGVPDCLPQTEVAPTAIPTEQWTPEWLAGYSKHVQALHADAVRRTAAAIVAQHVSMADVPRVGLLIGVFGPDDLDDALRKAGALVLGKVDAQYLRKPDGGDTQNAVLASTIYGRDGSTSIVTQPTGITCGDDGGVLLGVFPLSEPLEVGREYVVLATKQSDGNFAAIPGHAYSVQGDALALPWPELAETQLLGVDTIAALVARFEAIKAGRQVSPRPTP